MKKDMLIVGGIALAILGMAWYVKNKVGDLAGSAANAVVNGVTAVVPYVNPADSSNIINQGATSLYQGITGSTGTIGGDLYDILH